MEPLFLPLILSPPHPEAKPGKDCLLRFVFSVGYNSFVRNPSSPHLGSITQCSRGAQSKWQKALPV